MLTTLDHLEQIRRSDKGLTRHIYYFFSIISYWLLWVVDIQGSVYLDAVLSRQTDLIRRGLMSCYTFVGEYHILCKIWTIQIYIFSTGNPLITRELRSQTRPCYIKQRTRTGFNAIFLYLIPDFLKECNCIVISKKNILIIYFIIWDLAMIIIIHPISRGIS